MLGHNGSLETIIPLSQSSTEGHIQASLGADRKLSPGFIIPLANNK
jgi:hypothetical protein